MPACQSDTTIMQLCCNYFCFSIFLFYFNIRLYCVNIIMHMGKIYVFNVLFVCSRLFFIHSAYIINLRFITLTINMYSKPIL